MSNEKEFMAQEKEFFYNKECIDSIERKLDKIIKNTTKIINLIYKLRQYNANNYKKYKLKKNYVVVDNLPKKGSNNERI